ncbi:MAG UNVERIFIED_CONTAM: twin-arginine translocation signal domain-containing protein [Planctomycetaceae bacterium]|jgi:cell division GTPase FtsZ
MQVHAQNSRTRRSFLQQSTVFSAGLFLGAAPQPRSHLDKLRIAVIGCGGRGGGNLQSVSSEHIARAL